MQSQSCWDKNKLIESSDILRRPRNLKKKILKVSTFNVKTLRKIAPNFYGLPRKPELYSPTNCTFFSWPIPLNSFGQRSCLLLMMKVGCCSVALIANDLIEKPPTLAWMNRIKDLWVMELQMHHAHWKTFSFSNIIHKN